MRNNFLLIHNIDSDVHAMECFHPFKVGPIFKVTDHYLSQFSINCHLIQIQQISENIAANLNYNVGLLLFTECFMDTSTHHL